MEAGNDGCDSLLDQCDQLLRVHVLWLAGRGQRHGRVLLGLLMPRNDLIAKDGLQDAVHLSETEENTGISCRNIYNKTFCLQLDPQTKFTDIPQINMISLLYLVLVQYFKLCFFQSFQLHLVIFLNRCNPM